MHILANVDTFAPLGGVELSTLQVCQSLAGRGHQVDVLYVDGGGLQEEWTSFARRTKQVPGFTVEFARPWRQARVLPKSVLAGIRSTPDVIYLNRSEQLLWGALTSKLAHAPLVCHLRHHPFSAAAVRLLGRAAQQYIAVSDFVRNEWISAGIRRDRIHVVHNGVHSDAYPSASDFERSRLRAEMQIPADARVFLCYGRLTAEKGVDVLLRAWNRAQVPENWLLLLVGDASVEIARSVQEFPRPSVRLLDRRDDVTGLLGVADVTVLPALWHEPFGRVVIESMSAGVPVIASRRGGIPEILAGPWARFLFDPDAEESLVCALRSIGEWRTEEPGLGESCRSYVQHAFGLAKTVDGVEEVLNSVI
jgi:glycosyltransferase involved in cell wall biosynthesis